MTDRYASRLTILEDQEIEELYGRPQFTHDERVHFFSLTPQERRIVYQVEVDRDAKVSGTG